MMADNVCVQSELALLLYPVFVHLYMDMVIAGHGQEGTPVFPDPLFSPFLFVLSLSFKPFLIVRHCL